MTKLDLFKELARPDSNGKSRWVDRSEFVGKYKSLYTENGLSWGRQDSFPYILDLKRDNKRIVSYKCVGFNKVPNKSIRKEIVNSIIKKRCILLGTSKPEADHKNGRYNNPRVNNKTTQKHSDFQPLGQAANKAKRQSCKNCKKTNQRFDAKILGFEKSFSEGEKEYLESPDGCIGCFWYDVRDFQKKIKII
tara:strand:+ start:553 stop:1128 length:576 start_codon:yes stop_codon:yes gene_type:complete